MKIKRVLVCSLVAALYLYADSNVYELGQVEITSSSDMSQNRATAVVNSQDIKDSESKNVIEALDQVPGVFVDKLGAKNQESIRIRGFKSSRVPVYVDGIPIYVPYNRQTDLSCFTPYDLSEITISKGYTSPMYGANTIGGAVNLITKKPTKTFEGELGVGVFSGSGQEEYLTLGTNQGLYYGLISVSNYERDYFKLSHDYSAAGYEDGGKRENSDAQNRKINIKVGYTPNATDEYSFNYIKQKSSKGQPYFADEKLPFVFNGMYKRNWYWPAWDKTSYYFITKTALNDVFTVKSRWYRDEFYNKIEMYPNPTLNVLDGTSEYDDYTMGGNVELDVKFLETQSLKLSVTQKRDYHKSIDSDYPGSDIKAEGTTTSFGAEYTIKPIDKFTWILGASYDKNKVDKAQYRDGGVIGEFDKYSSDAFNPETALYYEFDESTTFYGSIAKKSNMPSLSDRYSTKFSTYTPNPELKAERAINYEIGIEKNFADTHLVKASIFLSKAKDYIASVNLSGGMKQSQNIGEEEHKGFEVSLDSFWSDNVTTNFSYTHIKAKVEDNPDTPYVTDIPKHSFIGKIKYTPIATLDAIPEFRYESSRYINNELIYEEYKTKAFFLMDLKVAYRVMKDLEVAAGVKNLFDKNYYYSYGYPEEGRNYYANFRYIF